jgi:hypothetical protein
MHFPVSNYKFATHEAFILQQSPAAAPGGSAAAGGNA